jgi:hypothetical protein
MLKGAILFGKALREAAFATNDSGRYWRLSGARSGGVVERRFGDHTGPRIEDERCAIRLRLVGGKERIKRVPCHALDRDLQIDHRCLGLFIKSDHAIASGIGEGAHAAAASVAGNCQCHAGVRKAALPDGRRCGAACSGHLKAVTGQSGRARAELDPEAWLADDTLPHPRHSPVAPRIVRRERGLSQRLAKEDRPLSIAPQFFDRDATF